MGKVTLGSSSITLQFGCSVLGHLSGSWSLDTHDSWESCFFSYWHRHWQLSSQILSHERLHMRVVLFSIILLYGTDGELGSHVQWKVKHNIGLLGLVEPPCVVMRQCIVMSPVPCHRLSSYRRLMPLPRTTLQHLSIFHHVMPALWTWRWMEIFFHGGKK